MPRDAWLEINLDNLRENIHFIQQIIQKKTDIIAVVKADAYGHGCTEITQVLIEEGVHYFAFATLDEAITFKIKHPNENALILGICPHSHEKLIIQYDIEQTIQSFSQAKILDEEAKKQNKKAKIHIKIDTGMSRFGFLAEDENDLQDILKLFTLQHTEIKGIFTHFTSSGDEDGDEICSQQITIFEKVLNYIQKNQYPLPKIHVSTSSTILLRKQYNFDMVRIGIALYGINPLANKEQNTFPLKPIMSLKAKVVRIKKLHKQKTVGYSRSYKLEQDEKIATLPLGYADGLRANADNSYQVYAKGKRHFLAGKICMDALMIRVHPDCDLQEGDEATLFGWHEDGFLPMEELAKALGFINYELATGLRLRLRRIYINKGQRYSEK